MMPPHRRPAAAWLRYRMQLMATTLSDQTVQMHSTRMRPVGAYFIVLGMTAVMLALIFAPVGWSALAFVALAPAAVAAVRAGGTRRLIWTSYVVAALWWLWMLRWLIPVTGFGYVLLAGFMAVYLPASLVMLRWLHLVLRVPVMFALPMAWVTCELVRSSWPSGGFAWFMLGHSLAPYEPAHGLSRLIQVADMVGDYGVSFLVAMTSGLIADALTMQLYLRGRGSRRRVNPRVTVLAGVWAAVMAVAMTYGYIRIEQVKRAETPIARLAVVQTDVPVSNRERPKPGQVQQAWQTMLGLTLLVAKEDPKPDVIVWPETVVPAALNAEALETVAESAQYDGDIRDLVRTTRVHLLVGAPAAYHEPYHHYNAAFHYRPDASQATRRYDKIHRVPFGEYIPWVEWWPWLKQQFIAHLTPYDHDYTLTAGRAPAVFEMALDIPPADAATRSHTVRLATPICFEDTDARLCRQMVYGRDGRKRVDVLVNLTNDAWFWPQERVQHLQIAVFRSVENRVPIARSVNTGVSGFISAAGEILKLAGEPSNRLGRSVVIQQIKTNDIVTIFGGVGHVPAVAVAVLTVGLCLAGLIGRRRLG